ncbi:hypothetical protein BN59_00685 [Legionella massiliensis]|uniref:Uncharacterized protein n=1 Tax=Legionella massiliensis TaxID=1034943 RepID=A0A078KTR4_9GAMM|nr:hypothetical protein BN59_00685 [Legionella massiliensis]CEE12154.1 hypothetical protein BN1094_00685 [Legionella massiliensis]
MKIPLFFTSRFFICSIAIGISCFFMRKDYFYFCYHSYFMGTPSEVPYHWSLVCNIDALVKIIINFALVYIGSVILSRLLSKFFHVPKNSPTLTIGSILFTIALIIGTGFVFSPLGVTV